MVDVEMLQNVPGNAGQVHELVIMAYYVLPSLSLEVHALSALCLCLPELCKECDCDGSVLLTLESFPEWWRLPSKGKLLVLPLLQQGSHR
jgi:hypothetical protein